MKVSEERIQQIIAEVGVRFRTFGGGVSRMPGNPFSEATKERPLAFAGDVPVADVVRFILEEAERQ